MKKPGDGSGPLTSRLTTGRLVPVALVATLLLGAGAIWLASRGSDPAQGDDPRAGATGPAGATATADSAIVPTGALPTPTPTPTPAPTPTAAGPSRTTTPPTKTSQRPPTTPPPPPKRTTAPPPAASLSASAGTKCVWPGGGGWVINLRGTVRNGTPRSATGWHGGSSSGSYSLSVSGNTVYGEIPPNIYEVSELFGGSAPWSMTVTLTNGRTLKASGTAYNPC